MSPKLPVVKSRDLVRVAIKLGFVFDHQTGSHAVYYREKDKARAVILMHTGKDIRTKTLESILEDRVSRWKSFGDFSMNETSRESILTPPTMLQGWW